MPADGRIWNRSVSPSCAVSSGNSSISGTRAMSAQVLFQQYEPCHPSTWTLPGADSDPIGTSFVASGWLVGFPDGVDDRSALAAAVAGRAVGAGADARAVALPDGPPAAQATRIHSTAATAVVGAPKAGRRDRVIALLLALVELLDALHAAVVASATATRIHRHTDDG